MGRLITVEPVLCAFMFSVFINFPVLEQLIYEKICDHHYNKTVCTNIKASKAFADQEDFVQKMTSSWMLYINMATTFPSMLAAIILGSCSDKIGRKFALILPLIGAVIEGTALILNAHFMYWPVSTLLVGVTISGFFGNYATILMAVFAYISDVSSVKNRTLRISLLESMIFIGGSLGELIGGLLVGKVGYFVTFSLAAGIHVCNLIYVVCVLQESYFPEQSMTVKEALMSFENAVKAFRIFVKPRINKGRRNLLLMMVALFFALTVYVGANTVNILFVMHSPLSFSSTMVGYFLATNMLCAGFGVIVGMPLFVYKLKLQDYTMAIIGCSSLLIFFTLFAFTTNLWMAFTVILANMFGGVSIPCIRSACSKIVEKNEKGSMFSAIAAIEVLCSVVASVLFNNVYAATVAWYPGFTFFIMAALLVVPIIIFLFLRIIHTRIPYSTLESSQGTQAEQVNQPVAT